MSANIDTLAYVGEVPWHRQGTFLTEVPTTPEEIVAAAQLDWNVSAHQLSSDIDSDIPGWYGIYRDDANKLLGVVHRSDPQIVQNTDTFNEVREILGNKVTFETAASLGIGETVFGCFKISSQYKVIDDDVDHYFVIVNDHLRPDGKVTILNTPVRVVCQNTLQSALGNASAKIRIPIFPAEFTESSSYNQSVIDTILESAADSINSLDTRAEKLLNIKTDTAAIIKIEDYLFPFQEVGGEVLDSRANDKIQVRRDTFLKCLDVDNLQNYKGTAWAVYNALTDYEQHYFSNPNKIYDLKYRMSKLEGVTTASEVSLANKYLKAVDKFSA